MRDLITRLGRPVLRRLRRDDQGAVAVLVAVLVAGGVLLGIGALVIDVGEI
jgi:Flp pilus assembly protein TadG